MIQLKPVPFGRTLDVPPILAKLSVKPGFPSFIESLKHVKPQHFRLKTAKELNAEMAKRLNNPLRGPPVKITAPEGPDETFSLFGGVDSDDDYFSGGGGGGDGGGRPASPIAPETGGGAASESKGDDAGDAEGADADGTPGGVAGGAKLKPFELALREGDDDIAGLVEAEYSRLLKEDKAKAGGDGKGLEKAAARVERSQRARANVVAVLERAGEGDGKAPEGAAKTPAKTTKAPKTISPQVQASFRRGLRAVFVAANKAKAPEASASAASAASKGPEAPETTDKPAPRLYYKKISGGAGIIKELAPGEEPPADGEPPEEDAPTKFSSLGITADKIPGLENTVEQREALKAFMAELRKDKIVSVNFLTGQTAMENRARLLAAVGLPAHAGMPGVEKLK